MDWSAVIISISGFIASVAVAYVTGAYSIRATQRGKLVDTRREAYNHYLETLRFALLDSEHVMDFNEADWKARLVASEPTLELMNAVRSIYCKAELAVMEYEEYDKPIYDLETIYDLMDQLTRSMAEDLRHTKR